MTLALLCPLCCDVASLQLVLVVLPLFRWIRCFILFTYVAGLIQAFLVYLCVFQHLLGSLGFL